jgi:hypothetical protein
LLDYNVKHDLKKHIVLFFVIVNKRLEIEMNEFKF